MGRAEQVGTLASGGLLVEAQLYLDAGPQVSRKAVDLRRGPLARGLNPPEVALEFGAASQEQPAMIVGPPAPRTARGPCPVLDQSTQLRLADVVAGVEDLGLESVQRGVVEQAQHIGRVVELALEHRLVLNRQQGIIEAAGALLDGEREVEGDLLDV